MVGPFVTFDAGKELSPMDVCTVGDCDRLVDVELAAAKSACAPAERNVHLNRAASFAYCSEQGRREALLAGLPLEDDTPCRPDVSVLGSTRKGGNTDD